jgi:acyl carrier protein
MDTKAVLKQALVDELHLEDVSADDIVDGAPLFGEGLGLDSLDAIELVVLVQRRFGIDMENVEGARQAFASVNALVDYIETHRG